MNAPSALLEREATVNDVLARVDAAFGGTGSVVFIDGEAGAGKTSVIKEVEARIPSTMLVLAGSCDPLATPRPFGPLRDVVAMNPDLKHILDVLDTPHEALGELLEQLRHSVRPVLFVVEDLHWADDGTLDMVTYLGRRIETTKAVMLITVRGNQLDPGNRVGITVSGLQSRTGVVRRIHLEPLSVDAVARLAGDRRDQAASIHSITGGNAFFVTELLASDDQVPATVQDAVMARIGRLSSLARSTAETVAIAPRELERRHLQALTGTSAYVFDEAVYAGVLIGEHDTYRFRHELARRAVEDSMSPPRRVDLHRRMLDLLLGEGSTDLSRLAHHAVRSEDADLILRFAPAAARESALRGSKREAASYFAAALPFASSLATNDRLSLLVDYAQSLFAIDRQADALAVSAEALALARELGDDHRIAEATLVHERALWLNGDSQRAMDLVDEAIALLEPSGDSPDLAYALYIGGTMQMLDRHRDAAVKLSERSLSMARRIGSTHHEALAHISLGTAELVIGDPIRGIDLLERAFDLAVTDGTRANVLSMLGTGGGEVKLYDRALEWLDRAIALETRHDGDYPVAYATAWISRIKAEQGHWDEAIRSAERVTSLPPEVARISPVTALGTVGRIGVRRGDPAAVGHLVRATELGGRGAIQHTWVALCATAENHIYGNRPHEAVNVLTGPLERILATDTLWGRGEIAFWMWMAGGLAAVPDRLAEPYRLMIDGDWEAAADMWHRIGSPYEEAMALSLGPAEAALRSLEIFDRLGARPMGSRVRARLRSEGVRSIPRGPIQSTVSDPHGLTGRQREVLELVAEGLTNEQIADRLFVAPKTVENHVSAILLKLGASSRSEAVALASPTI